jgi:Derlin-2/3
LLTLLLSRNIATCAFVVSLGILLGMLPSGYFIYHTFFILRFPPQIWRFATSFLITGSGLGLLFDTYFLYTYLSQMEVGNPRFPRKEDLIWYLVFVCGTILVSSQARVLQLDDFSLSRLCAPSPEATATQTPHISARIVQCLYYYHGSWK